MAGADEQVTGPPMICATRVMKPGGTRIGRIAGDITLPRTVAMTTAVAVLAGAAAGVLLAAVFSAGLTRIGYAAIVGGGVGWFVTNFSPLAGESLATWALLQLGGLRHRRRIDGRVVTLAVGVAVADRTPIGPAVLARAAIRVDPNAYDDRGVLRSAANRNVTDPPRAATGKPRRDPGPVADPGTVDDLPPAAATAPRPAPWGQLYPNTARRGRR